MCAILSQSGGSAHVKQRKIVQTFRKSKKRIKGSDSSAHHGTQAGRPRDHRSGGGGTGLQGGGGGAGLLLDDRQQMVPPLPEVRRRGP